MCPFAVCGAGFFTSTTAAIQDCPLPAFYSERYDTHELRALPPPCLPQQYTHLANLPILSPTTAETNPSAGPGPKSSSVGYTPRDFEASPGLTNPKPETVSGNQQGPAEGANRSGFNPSQNPDPVSRQEGMTQGLTADSASRVEGGEGLETLSNRFADKMQWQLMVPMELWLHAFREAKVGGLVCCYWIIGVE